MKRHIQNTCEADMEELAPGKKVLLHSLKKTTLNGQHGILDKFDVASQRWCVKLSDRFVHARPQNICHENGIHHQALHDMHDKTLRTSDTQQDQPQEEIPWDDEKITIHLQLLSGIIHDLRMDSSCQLSDLRKVVAETVGSPWSSRSWRLIGSDGVLDGNVQDCLTLAEAGVVEGTSITAVHARSLCGVWHSNGLRVKFFSIADDTKIRARILSPSELQGLEGEIEQDEDDDCSFSATLGNRTTVARRGFYQTSIFLEGELSRDGRAIVGTFQRSRIILKKETS
eukprot:gnl/MRDRNA2_/MRDRNA2_112826_c0_seq1.p1 gnl/MRDRNA2_/MRDRNA2_112826_c0~~gnl/MRDRNA2_/MRDRNA2_112826_c0_seq1.p1  ORF type:complete len:284 (-),score=62.83 gnl/MRDRNA2_/MRDRNA2_112826_c0_seq1:130-981(-)